MGRGQGGQMDQDKIMRTEKRPKAKMVSYQFRKERGVGLVNPEAQAEARIQGIWGKTREQDSY